jgi:hypothetical protein
MGGHGKRTPFEAHLTRSPPQPTSADLRCSRCAADAAEAVVRAVVPELRRLQRRWRGARPAGIPQRRCGRRRPGCSVADPHRCGPQPALSLHSACRHACAPALQQRSKPTWHLLAGLPCHGLAACQVGHQTSCAVPLCSFHAGRWSRIGTARARPGGRSASSGRPASRRVLCRRGCPRRCLGPHVAHAMQSQCMNCLPHRLLRRE